ncbi:MAG: tRNA (Uridine-5-oxyacetic acid methyl ester) 34 synthase [uncultured Sulfurovum sp.]|uniref:tRNA (Uridine-5-oxyacetic acid methyl ester) 34 synthase n=1 Tax=uncultured Sulfurovum sp. TaxID=269237 RepID=A0A6S6S6B9_9BACT|nr:MAG: tRNA (Uridine-5-oxyacetic acid methyl ester) 34 synthase [uncultured Sulfurovum sp.]
MGDSGDRIEAMNANWKFSGEMVENFEAHVSKSVPLYKEGHALIKKLSDYFIKDDSLCYELGSSTGTLVQELAAHHAFRNAKFIGIEIEEDMVNKANKLYQNTHLSFVCDDMNTMNLEKSDLIVSYYTIQFIHPKLRQQLINKIYQALNWGGAFIVYEKVRANDARFQDIMSGLYMEYKLDQGYKAEEIIAKQKSLKGILEPFSTEGNIDMFKRAGFVDIISIQKYMNFEGFLLIK